jgi:hypothetical protein
MASIELPWHPREQGLLIIKHQEEEELGHHMGRWMVHWTSIRTLQVLHGLHNENKIKQNSGNSQFFST